MSKQRGRITRAAQRLAGALDGRYTPRLEARGGTIRSVEYGATGPLRAEVSLGGGAEVTVNAAGRTGVEPGASVLLRYAGPALIAWELVSSIAGGGAGAPSMRLSTPAIDSVTTLSDLGTPGLVAAGDSLSGRGMTGSASSPAAQGLALVRSIPEELAGVRVVYDLEIVDTATGARVWASTCPERMVTRGVLGAFLSAEQELTGAAITLSSWNGLWPSEIAVATLGDIGVNCEHVWIVGPPRITVGGHELYFATGRVADVHGVRAYQGTLFGDGSPAAEAWLVGTPITLTSAGLGFHGLAPDREYQARVRARASVGGGASAWSEWFDFTTATDTAAPGWSGDNTPTVTTTERAFTVTWPPATVDATDLARYEVDVSADGSAWSTRNAGNATLWIESAPWGATRSFRVRAVDTSGNASAWSPTVTARLATPGDPAGANLLANPTFATDVSDWSLISLSGTATLTRVTDVYYDAPGAARLEDTRGAIMSTAELTSGAVAITPRRLIYLRAYVRTQGAIAGDTVTLVLTLTGGGTHTASAHAEATKIGSDWTRLSAMIEAPAAATHAAALLSWTIAAGLDSSPRVWLDDAALIEVEPGTPAAVMWGHLTSDPGGEARPLATGADGGLALRRLSLGEGGATLTGYLSATTAWDPPSLANGASASTTVTVAGAAVGDPCIAGLASITAAGWVLSASVTAADTVTVVLFRAFGGTSDLGSGTLRVGVFKH